MVVELVFFGKTLESGKKVVKKKRAGKSGRVSECFFWFSGVFFGFRWCWSLLLTFCV